MSKDYDQSCTQLLAALSPLLWRVLRSSKDYRAAWKEEAREHPLPEICYGGPASGRLTVQCGDGGHHAINHCKTKTANQNYLSDIVHGTDGRLQKTVESEQAFKFGPLRVRRCPPSFSTTT